MLGIVGRGAGLPGLPPGHLLERPTLGGRLGPIHNPRLNLLNGQPYTSNHAALSALTRRVGLVIFPALLLFFLLRRLWAACLATGGFAAAALLAQQVMGDAGGA